MIDVDPINGPAQVAVASVERTAALARKLNAALVVYVAAVLTVAAVISGVLMYRVGVLAEDNTARLKRERTATIEAQRVVEEFRSLIDQQLSTAEANHELLVRVDAKLDALLGRSK